MPTSSSMLTFFRPDSRLIHDPNAQSLLDHTHAPLGNRHRSRLYNTFNLLPSRAPTNTLSLSVSYRDNPSPRIALSSRYAVSSPRCM